MEEMENQGKVDSESLAAIHDQIKADRKLRRHLRRDPYRDLIPFRSQILAFAKRRVSKSILHSYCCGHLSVDASADRLYRFVRKVLGYWPNAEEERGDE